MITCQLFRVVNYVPYQGRPFMRTTSLTVTVEGEGHSLFCLGPNINSNNAKPPIYNVHNVFGDVG